MLCDAKDKAFFENIRTVILISEKITLPFYPKIY